MDCKSNASSLDEGVPNEKTRFCRYQTIKNEPTTGGNEFETDNKISIKVEANDLDVSIKEEPLYSVTELQNVEYMNCIETETRTKHDTITGIDFKMESKIEFQRSTTGAVDQDENFQNFPAASDFKTASTPLMKSNTCSFSLNPACNIQHFGSIEKPGDQNNFSSQRAINVDTMCLKQQNLFKCDICGKNFKQNSRLEQHKWIHLGTKSYPCENCDRCFKWKSSLKKHQLIHLGTKPHKCENCDKCFTWKSELKIHQLIHSGTKPYKCNDCEKCFTCKSALRRHIMIHLGTKAYKCEDCGKCFTCKSALNKHILVHLGTKAYKCENCDMCFTWQSGLIRHMLTHSGIKPYKCGNCDKCFSCKAGLKQHLLTHSGTKLYKCDNCDKCYRRMADLKIHKPIHSGSLP